jgi:hypothetical protein
MNSWLVWPVVRIQGRPRTKKGEGLGASTHGGRLEIVEPRGRWCDGPISIFAVHRRREGGTVRSYGIVPRSELPARYPVHRMDAIA